MNNSEEIRINISFDINIYNLQHILFFILHNRLYIAVNYAIREAWA